MSTVVSPAQTPIWGWLAILTGAVALVLAMLVIFAGPFAPQPSTGTVIGQIAGDMIAAARGSLDGSAQPAPVPRGWDVDRVLATLTPILGVLALCLAVMAAIRREPWRLSSYGAALGGAAIVIQFVWWIALLICGVVLLVAIIENLGGFAEGFGG
ncbi:hypothetical protein [Roseicyclus mahoneyensis]|uniref:Uncharacterized protein n=1 Tax=Roseicyclus mahoneyensis TaxID=164332 RepID=A0A316GQ92_9RHOB|nr:hypothetical protein [Roseicyclus mahoneyensis]PWK62202.1 hypothetical protein C7455_101228 [Roseicyclus mahoneyensis]